MKKLPNQIKKSNSAKNKSKKKKKKKKKIRETLEYIR